MLAAEAYVHRWLGTYQKCVDCFLVPSQFTKTKLAEYGWDAGKIHVLPHFQKLPCSPVPDIAQKAPILYFGRLSEEKGIADLLRAIRQVAGVHAQIAGDGPQRQDLETLARQIAAPVDFVGHQTGADLDRLIASASFTVFPSRAYETLGKSILESFAWGRPVVASDLGSRGELVHHGRTGLLFPPGDERRLAEAISYLSTNPAIVAEMGAAARELVRRRHSPERYYRELNQLYEDLRMRKESAPPRPARPNLPKLRVALIGGRGVISKYCGIETCYEEIGKRLVEMGHEVTVYCRSYFTPKMEQHAGMRLVRLPTIRSKHLDTLIHTFLSTIHAMCAGCDIVHYHALGPSLFAFLPRLLGKKTVVTVQGLDWQRKKWGWIASAVLRLGEFASARLPNATIVVSRTLQQHYRARSGIEPFYVPNGAGIRKSSHPSRLRQWGLQPGRYILFAGRFSPEKNCHLLIAAYEKINTRVKLV
ncbi:MAG TPA: glycosyltransferase family 4 protein, partial [Terriglobales bacterium]